MLMNCTTDHGRFITPKWPNDARAAGVRQGTKNEGISRSSPSGLPSVDATSRVKPDISVHAPSAAACFFQWKYMMRDCHSWYVVACAVSSVWYGRCVGGHDASETASEADLDSMATGTPRVGSAPSAKLAALLILPASLA
eukprot:6204648-Pleurochrysis_carterae.AAC.2